MNELGKRQQTNVTLKILTGGRETPVMIIEQYLSFCFNSLRPSDAYMRQ